MAEYGHDDEGAHKIEAMKAEMNAPGEEDFEPQRGWHSIYPLFVFNEPMESVWEKQPTFLIIEFLLLFLAAWGITDALKRRRGTITRVHTCTCTHTVICTGTRTGTRTGIRTASTLCINNLFTPQQKPALPLFLPFS